MRSLGMDRFFFGLPGAAAAEVAAAPVTEAAARATVVPAVARRKSLRSKDLRIWLTFTPGEWGDEG